jgi:hypothetical protein
MKAVNQLELGLPKDISPHPKLLNSVQSLVDALSTQFELNTSEAERNNNIQNILQSFEFSTK